MSLSDPTWLVLNVVRRAGRDGASVSDVREHAGLGHRKTQNALHALEQLGLIRRYAQRWVGTPPLERDPSPQERKAAYRMIRDSV